MDHQMPDFDDLMLAGKAVHRFVNTSPYTVDEDFDEFDSLMVDDHFNPLYEASYAPH